MRLAPEARGKVRAANHASAADVTDIMLAWQPLPTMSRIHKLAGSKVHCNTLVK
jgi:hypothetical protein